MNVAGMTRLSYYDIDKKKAADVVKYCIEDLSHYCNDIYFLQIGEVSSDFLSWLDVNKIITKSPKNYLEGWMFDNYASLEDLYKTVNKQYDWILYPDMDDVLPPQVLEELNKAENIKAEAIDFPMLECLDGVDTVICDFKNYVIGPHSKALKPSEDMTFIGSDGFAKPTTKSKRGIKIYNSPYPCRHLRYMNKLLLETRKGLSYYQDFFEKPHKTVKFDPSWKFHDYINHGNKI